MSVRECGVAGFGRDGIEIGSWNGTTGYRDVRVTNTSVHGNGRTGGALTNDNTIVAR